MATQNKQIESRIEDALDARKHAPERSIASLARDFDVPYQRLQRRAKGQKSLFSRKPTNRRLDESQEQALCNWIDYRDKLSRPVKQAEITRAALTILQSTEPDASLGPHWTHRFLARYPQYRRRRRRALDIERQRAADRTVVEKWFQSYQKAIEDYGILPEDIYNFDETGFQIGVGRDQWIITREPKKRIVSGSITNRESLTVVEAVSATGYTTPPLIILSAKTILFRWFDHLDDEAIAITESGYINDRLAYQWVQHFEKATRPRTLGVYRLLICDRYGSHMTYEFSKFCDDHRIIVAFLPPHTSHLLQPLDVGVFSVYKHWHSEAVEAATAIGVNKRTKDDFLAGIQDIRAKTFKISTIKLGFRLTGLWPIDSSQVVDNLVNYADSLPSTPSKSSDTNSSIYKTPNTAERFQRVENRLISLLDDIDTTRVLVGKLSKGARAAWYETQELRSEIHQDTAARLAREGRYNASRAGVRTNAIISSDKLARMKRIAQQGDDLEALNRLRPKWKKVMTELKRHCRMSGRRIK